MKRSGMATVELFVGAAPGQKPGALSLPKEAGRQEAAQLLSLLQAHHGVCEPEPRAQVAEENRLRYLPTALQ